MKRIYKNNDIQFKLSDNNFNLDIANANTVTLTFFTSSSENCIIKQKEDVNSDIVLLEWKDLGLLEEGILHFNYNVSYPSSEASDAEINRVDNILTDYYIVTGSKPVPEPVDKNHYYTKIEVDTKLDTKQEELISGKNIATINGQNLLVGKNIIINGEGGSCGGVGKKYDDTVYPSDIQIPDSYREMAKGEVFNNPENFEDQIQHRTYLANKARGIFSHAEGLETKAFGNYSHSEGLEAKAFGDGSHTEGYICSAYGNYSHAEGSNTSANKEASHSEGWLTNADGAYSHAEGESTEALSRGSHAEGISTDASGKASHSEGELCQALGNYSHVEGYNTKADNLSSHSEGYTTIASGETSHSQNFYTVAENKSQTSLGQFNVKESEPSAIYFDLTKTLVSVGNGTKDTDRSDALKMLGNGTTWISGIGGFTGKNSNPENSLQHTINNKQDNLISGETIKTINGESILGKGNIVISGGSGDGGVNKNNLKTINGISLISDTKEDLKIDGDTIHVKIYDQDTGTLNEFAQKIEDTTLYYVETFNSAITNKQDRLVSEENIKTINGESILGKGNITIEGGSGGTTNYNSLINKPSINDVELSGNKTIEELGLQPKGNYLTEHQDISGKVDKVSGKGLSTNDYTNTDKAEVAKVRNKQDILLSGTNIKTINNQSILGSGNITIEGGSGGGKPSGGYQKDLYETLGAKWNGTHYELNGLTDITEDEMAMIYLTSATYSHQANLDIHNAFEKATIRTNFYSTKVAKPIYSARRINADGAFGSCEMEVVKVYEDNNPSNNNAGIYLSSAAAMFQGSKKLKKIIGRIILDKSCTNCGGMILFCSLLESVEIKGLMTELKLNGTPNLDKPSILYLINNRSGDNTISIRMEKSMYNKYIADSDVTSAAQAHNITLVSI